MVTTHFLLLLQKKTASAWRLTTSSVPIHYAIWYSLFEYMSVCCVFTANFIFQRRINFFFSEISYTGYNILIGHTCLSLQIVTLNPLSIWSTSPYGMHATYCNNNNNNKKTWNINFHLRSQYSMFDFIYFFFWVCVHFISLLHYFKCIAI